MFAGFPPLKEAKRGDWWFERLKQRKYERFWAAHTQTAATFSDTCKEFVQQILSVDPAERITIAQMKDVTILTQTLLLERKLHSTACGLPVTDANGWLILRKANFCKWYNEPEYTE